MLCHGCSLSVRWKHENIFGLGKGGVTTSCKCWDTLRKKPVWTPPPVTMYPFPNPDLAVMILQRIIDFNQFLYQINHWYFYVCNSEQCKDPESCDTPLGKRSEFFAFFHNILGEMFLKCYDFAIDTSPLQFNKSEMNCQWHKSSNKLLFDQNLALFDLPWLSTCRAKLTKFPVSLCGFSIKKQFWIVCLLKHEHTVDKNVDIHIFFAFSLTQPIEQTEPIQQ